MEWDSFKNTMTSEYFFPNKVETNIKCPNCGRNLFERTDIVLTSNPPQYQYECECGFVNYAFSRWTSLSGWQG